MKDPDIDYCAGCAKVEVSRRGEFCRSCVTKVKRQELLDRYRQLAAGNLALRSRSAYDVSPDGQHPGGLYGLRRHALWMLYEMASIKDENKFNRWLGFVQGILWSEKLATLDELR